MSDDTDRRAWRDLKRTVFDSLMTLTGRVFVVVQHAPDVIIGRRGFLPEEQERGLVLVFNASMPLRWEGDSLHARLVFGSRPEDCMIPVDRIVAMYNPDRQVQFLVPPREAARAVPDGEPLHGSALHGDGTEPMDCPGDDSPEGQGGKVVRVDFGRSRRD